MVATSEGWLLRPKSGSSTRQMVGVQVCKTHEASAGGCTAERTTTPSPSPLESTKSNGSIKDGGMGLLRRMSSSGSKSATLKQNGSEKSAKTKGDDDGSSKGGGIGLLLRRMSSGGSKGASVERNNNETSGEKVVKTSSKAEEKYTSSGGDDATPNDVSEQMRQPPPQSAEDHNSLKHSDIKIVNSNELHTELENRDTKSTIERGRTPTPPLPVQIPSTSSTDSKMKPITSKIPRHPSSSRSSTPEIKCNDSTKNTKASISNLSNKGNTSKPDHSWILQSFSGQSRNSQKTEKNKANSHASCARKGLPPIPVARSSDTDMKAKVDPTPPKPTITSSLGIKRCSSESAGSRFGLKLNRSSSSTKRNIVTKSSDSEGRKNLVKGSIGILKRSKSDGVSAKNTPKSAEYLQCISFESNHSSLIKVTHSKASIIKINNSLMSKSGEMMASSFAASPREEPSSELGMEIVRSMDSGKSIHRAEPAIEEHATFVAPTNPTDGRDACVVALRSANDEDDEKREDAENEGEHEHLCICTKILFTPQSSPKGINGLEDDMKNYTFGYGYSLYVKSLDIYQRELNMMEEKKKENQEQETDTNKEEKDDEQEEKREEEKQNAVGDKVKEEEQPKSSDSDVPDETTETPGSLPIVTIVETTMIKQFSEDVVATSTLTTTNTPAQPAAEDGTTSRDIEQEKAKNIFGGHPWKQLMKWCACLNP